jgi:nitroreductase
MDFFEVVKRRRSTRAYAAKPIDADRLAKILAAANAAPSAGNLQAFEIYRVTDPERRRELARAALHQSFIAQAPEVLVFCANPARSAARYRQRGVRLYALQDATIACTFAMLAATTLGLSSVWVGAFDDQEVHRVIGAQNGHIPVAMLPIGYAAETPELTMRRSLDDLVHQV